MNFENVLPPGVIPLEYGKMVPYEPRTGRLPVVQQALELAVMMPKGVERTKLLKSAARVWAVSTCVMYVHSSKGTTDA